MRHVARMDIAYGYYLILLKVGTHINYVAMMWCGVVWCCVVWCGVMNCIVVYCGVVWCYVV